MSVSAEFPYAKRHAEVDAKRMAYVEVGDGRPDRVPPRQPDVVATCGAT